MYTMELKEIERHLLKCTLLITILLYLPDYCWFWDEKNKSDDVLVHNCGTEAYFHPDYSCGTAAIRGNRQFREGEEHYWEVQMSSAVYGTDMVSNTFVTCDNSL